MPQRLSVENIKSSPEMLKFISKDINTFKKIGDHPFLRKFFIFDLEQLPTLNDEEGFYKAMRPIRMANRITKKTCRQRFLELDVLSLKYFKENQTTKIHDVAVSDGITSVEFFDLLTKNNVQFELFISDKYSTIRKCGNLCKKYYDLDGNLLYVDALRLYISPTATPTNFLSKWMSYVFSWQVTNISNSKELLLLNPKTLRYLDHTNLTFIHYDIFEPTPLHYEFDFIKCMNILNLKYFSTAIISRAVGYLAETLKEEGVLLVGRTNREGDTHASFFKKENGHLHHMEDYHSGSEIKHIITP